MSRSHVYKPITDELGNLLLGAQVTLREADSSTLVTAPLYAGASTSQQIGNPFTAIDGLINVWTDRPRRINALIQVVGRADVAQFLDILPDPGLLIVPSNASTVGQVPVAQADGTVQWSGGAGSSNPYQGGVAPAPGYRIGWGVFYGDGTWFPTVSGPVKNTTQTQYSAANDPAGKGAGSNPIWYYYTGPGFHPWTTVTGGASVVYLAHDGGGAVANGSGSLVNDPLNGDVIVLSFSGYPATTVFNGIQVVATTGSVLLATY
jgi:hypothetical protein